MNDAGEEEAFWPREALGTKEEQTCDQGEITVRISNDHGDDHEDNRVGMTFVYAVRHVKRRRAKCLQQRLHPHLQLARLKPRGVPTVSSKS